jgi:hypothetical protein
MVFAVHSILIGGASSRPVSLGSPVVDTRLGLGDSVPNLMTARIDTAPGDVVDVRVPPQIIPDPPTPPSVEPMPSEAAPSARSNAGSGIAGVEESVGGGTEEVGHPSQTAGAGTEGTGGLNQTGTAGFFSAAVSARSVVYVVDRSLSMGLHGALDRVRQELTASLERLPAHVAVEVVVYNREALALAGDGLQPASPARKHFFLTRLEEIDPEGGTDHLSALRQAILLAPDVVFFLTDADDLTPELVRAVTRLNRGRSAIHVFELFPASREEERGPLRELARCNGGRYHAVPP